MRTLWSYLVTGSHPWALLTVQCNMTGWNTYSLFGYHGKEKKGRIVWKYSMHVCNVFGWEELCGIFLILMWVPHFLLLSYQTTLGQLFLYFLTTKLTHIIQHFVMVKLDSGLIASKHVPLNFNWYVLTKGLPRVLSRDKHEKTLPNTSFFGQTLEILPITWPPLLRVVPSLVTRTFIYSDGEWLHSRMWFSDFYCPTSKPILSW